MQITMYKVSLKPKIERKLINDKNKRLSITPVKRVTMLLLPSNIRKASKRTENKDSVSFEYQTDN